MTPIRIAVIIALLLVAGVVAKTPVQALGTAAQASSQTLNEVTSEQLLSSSVVAGWMAHPDAAGGALLDVLVLWRGTPGWWLTEGAHGGSGGGSFSTTTMHISRGGKELTVSFDVRTRIAHVLDKDIDVREANVVLIDDADAAGGPKVARTMTVAPQSSAVSPSTTRPSRLRDGAARCWHIRSCRTSDRCCADHHQHQADRRWIDHQH